MENRNTAIFDACQCPASSSDEARAVFVDHHPPRGAGSSQRAGGRLGIYATLASPPPDPEAARREARAERWRLKLAADRLRDGRQRACHRAKQSKDRPVTIAVSTTQTTRRAYYGGLQVCGSVWGCPICAAKISEGRRVELAAALASAQAQGLRVALLTLTIRHGMGDDVRELLAHIRFARRRLVSGKAAATWAAHIGLVGSIRALEVTYGEHGWHPHLHILLFLKKGGPTLDAIQQGYTTRWIDACVRAGLPAPLPGVACQVQDAAGAARYVGKWGLAEELSKSHLKKSRAGTRVGRTPWDLLRDYADGDERSGWLWREYAASFKGQVQLRWSKGLRALLGLGAGQTDQALAAADSPAAIVLAELSELQWQAIRYTQSYSAILDMAETAPASLCIALQQVVKLYLCNAGPDQRRTATRASMREMMELAG